MIGMADREFDYSCEHEALYTEYRQREDGSLEAVGYAYGEPWVSQALLMGDIKFKTPEDAVRWWESYKRKNLK